MNVFGVGPGEALLVLVIGLMVVGPGRFPELAREAGRWYRLARRYSTEVMADVRAAVDELEGEVTAPGEDLRSIRDIGSSFREDLREAGRAVSEIGRETVTVAESETKNALAAPAADSAPAETAAASPAGDATTADPLVEPDAATTAEPAATSAKAPASAAPAEPVSIRPSRRARPGAPVDPFEALAAKRERERARDTDDAQS